MRFGICTQTDRWHDVSAAGADYLEENVQTFLQGLEPNSTWNGLERAAKSKLPVVSANCLVPGDLKIVGPSVDMDGLQRYMKNVGARAKSVGIKILVFGSGAAPH